VADAVEAGRASRWLAEMLAALRGDQEADVPCGGCTACCASSQFVHVDPDEDDALAHIPEGLLFPAPGLPAGHRLLPYDEHGRCPLLGERGCTIYEHRPRACRTYDCRVLAAAAVDVGDDKPLVAERVGRWHFTVADDADREALRAVREAGAFLSGHGEELPGGRPSPTALAVLAVEAHGAFARDASPTLDEVVVEVRRRQARPRRP
jgi:hypothetical protein